MQIAIVGTGAMGAQVAREILDSAPDAHLTLIDASQARAESLRNGLPKANATVAKADARDVSELGAALRGAAVVVNAAQYDVNRDVMQAALQAACHYVDLGGMFHETRKQLLLSDAFRGAGLTAVVGMGAAPGITNVLAAHACAALERVDTIEASFAAALTGTPTSTAFRPPYSIRTIMQEFLDESVQFIDGKFSAQPPLAGRRMIRFPEPIGAMSCVYTLHSEPATLADSLQCKGVQRVLWRLGLPQILEERINAFAAAGLGSVRPIDFDGREVVPVEFLAASIEAHLGTEGNPGVPYTETGCLRTEVSGIGTGGQASTITMTCQRAVTAPQPDIAGVMTGAPCALAALMLADGRAANPGVHGPESVVPSGTMLTELSARGFLIVRETSEVL